MSQPRLAVLMSCHNRRDTTLTCLAAIYAQDIPSDIYLVDDGSSDGTSAAVSASYPAVKILQGNGNLFWGGGMQLAFSTALAAGYDFYLWLNDDTKLVPNALSQLLNTYQSHPNSIVVGSTQDPISRELTYGGMVRQSRWRRLNFSLLPPTEQPQECETMCGNCVLIPHIIASRVGTIDGEIFTHEFGDWDYGLRARQLGFSVWIAPGFIGTCSRNPIKGSWNDPNLSLIERFKKADKLKGGLQPRVWQEFARRHAGAFWLIYWASPYVRLVVASVFKSLEHPAVAIQK
ncbi:MAG TPA: glycosyltransferase family 2 protein [Cyanobacteria bacterium UBA11369]|nr:glycosyltransferase family 2 protein [Cyanobacteria bacterium UBA11371]HBE54357.1 glycosyltransferase family 2 protein [Cyanobacteria bacterium UBA11369]